MDIHDFTTSPAPAGSGSGLRLRFFYFSPLRERWEKSSRALWMGALGELATRDEISPGGLPPDLDGCALVVVAGNQRPEIAAKLSSFDRANVGGILDSDGSRGEFTNYGAAVIRLVKKADAQQRSLLRMIYPDHVAAVEEWERRDG